MKIFAVDFQITILPRAGDEPRSETWLGCTSSGTNVAASITVSIAMT